MSKGLALATMDQEYVNRFSFRSVTLRQRLLQGVQAAGVGIYEGVLGAPLPCIKALNQLPLNAPMSLHTNATQPL